MAAALLPRVGPGTPTILTHHHGEGQELGAGAGFPEPLGVCAHVREWVCCVSVGWTGLCSPP